MQPVFQQNSQRRSVRHAELLAVRARVSSQRPFLTGGGFLVLVISCGRDAAKLFPQFPGTGCFLPLAVSYRRPFPVAGRFLRLAHHPETGCFTSPGNKTVLKVVFAAAAAPYWCRVLKAFSASATALKVFKKARRDASSPALTKPPGEWEECYF